MFWLLAGLVAAAACEEEAEVKQRRPNESDSEYKARVDNYLYSGGVVDAEYGEPWGYY